MNTDDYIDDDDDDDLDLMPEAPRMLGLVVPAVAINEKVFQIETRGFVAAFPVPVVDQDGLIENREELLGFGLSGTDDEILRPFCRLTFAPPSEALIAELIEAMTPTASFVSPTSTNKKRQGTIHGPPA